MKDLKSLKTLMLGILMLMFCIGNVGKVYADKVDDLIEELKYGNNYVQKAAAEALEKIDPKWRESEAAKKAVHEFKNLGGENHEKVF